ncbi:MAG TPA: acetone carboxylase [Nocardioidaceae bacterium]|nr:acetone carboxylase [Nocardioidaceae bacterium]
MELVCSAKGCSRSAVWSLLWNNPKIHTPDRRKVWLACDEHRESLGDFLKARGFLRDILPAGSEDAQPR